MAQEIHVNRCGSSFLSLYVVSGVNRKYYNCTTRVVVSVSNVSVSRRSRGVFSNVSVSSRYRRSKVLVSSRSRLLTSRLQPCVQRRMMVDVVGLSEAAAGPQVVTHQQTFCLCHIQQSPWHPSLSQHVRHRTLGSSEGLGFGGEDWEHLHRIGKSHVNSFNEVKFFPAWLNSLTPTITHPMTDQAKLSFCNFWHPGTLTLRAERQSARMSKIRNDG